MPTTTAPPPSRRRPTPISFTISKPRSTLIRSRRLKSKAKAFTRTYGFLASILPYTNAEWEKLSIFLNFLVPKLPAPVEEDLSKGILEAIDMDSYRVEKQAARQIQLPDTDAEIEPVPTTGGGRRPEPELDHVLPRSDPLGRIAGSHARIDRIH